MNENFFYFINLKLDDLSKKLDLKELEEETENLCKKGYLFLVVFINIPKEKVQVLAEKQYIETEFEEQIEMVKSVFVEPKFIFLVNLDTVENEMDIKIPMIFKIRG